MFEKILVANRGEIAVRILRTCRELGLPSVAVFSEADSQCLHLKLADEKVCIGPPMSAKSYLNIEAIIAAAKKTGADAVHPGYGYLAENEKFAAECAANQIAFIGPSAGQLETGGRQNYRQKIGGGGRRAHHSQQ